MRLLKLQILTSRFENKEEESISDFNSKLCDIANEAFTIGEKYSEEKLVRKTLRSLPKRFAYKVTAIEEAKDVQNMKLEEWMGSLRTFEMNLEEEKGDKKPKGIAFQAENREVQTEASCDEDDDLAETMISCQKISQKCSRGLIESTMAVQGVEILAVAQLVFQHQEGTLNLKLTILMQVLETREFSAVNVKDLGTYRLSVRTL